MTTSRVIPAMLASTLLFVPGTALANSFSQATVTSTGIWKQVSSTFAGSVAYTAENTLYIGTQDERNPINTIKNGKEMSVVETETGPIDAFGVSPKGVLTATSWSGVLELLNNVWQRVGSASSPEGASQAIGWSPKGLLTASFGPSIGQYNGSEWTVLPKIKNSSLSTISALTWSPKGYLTIGGPQGDVEQFINGKWVQLGAGLGLPKTVFVEGLAYNPQGVLFAATDQGVYEYTNHWSLVSQLPHGHDSNIAVSPKGVLTVAIQDNGIWQFIAGKWNLLGTNQNWIKSADGVNGAPQICWSPSGSLTVSVPENNSTWTFVPSK